MKLYSPIFAAYRAGGAYSVGSSLGSRDREQIISRSASEPWPNDRPVPGGDLTIGLPAGTALRPSTSRPPPTASISPDPGLLR